MAKYTNLFEFYIAEAQDLTRVKVNGYAENILKIEDLLATITSTVQLGIGRVDPTSSDDVVPKGVTDLQAKAWEEHRKDISTNPHHISFSTMASSISKSDTSKIIEAINKAAVDPTFVPISFNAIGKQSTTTPTHIFNSGIEVNGTMGSTKITTGDIDSSGIGTFNSIKIQDGNGQHVDLLSLIKTLIASEISGGTLPASFTRMAANTVETATLKGKTGNEIKVGVFNTDGTISESCDFNMAGDLYVTGSGGVSITKGPLNAPHSKITTENLEVTQKAIINKLEAKEINSVDGVLRVKDIISARVQVNGANPTITSSIEPTRSLGTLRTVGELQSEGNIRGKADIIGYLSTL